jgi:hypothetical protein
MSFGIVKTILVTDPSNNGPTPVVFDLSGNAWTSVDTVDPSGVVQEYSNIGNLLNTYTIDTVPWAVDLNGYLWGTRRCSNKIYYSGFRYWHIFCGIKSISVSH